MENGKVYVVGNSSGIDGDLKGSKVAGCSYHNGESSTSPLESADDRRSRRRSHLIIYITTFIVSIGFSVVLTGIWPYMQILDPTTSKEFLGWVVAANPMGQFVASPLLGYWSNKVGSNRIAFLTTVILYICGNALYSVAFVFGSIALCRSYISSSTTLDERTIAVSVTAATQAMGFIVGPAIQTALAVGFVEDSGSKDFFNATASSDLSLLSNGYFCNIYTAAGWVAVFLGIINFVLFMPCIFKEYHIAEKEARHMSRFGILGYPSPDYFAIFGVLFSFSVIQFIFVLIEAMIVPMCIDMYAWSAEKTVKIVGVGLSIGGLLSFLMFIVSGYLSKLFDERKIYIYFGIILVIIAMIITFPMGSNYSQMQNCTYIIANESYSDYTDTSDLTSTHSFSSIVKLVKEDENCNDIGCPVEQEWCTYTPIIEIPQMIVSDVIVLIGYTVCFSISNALYSKMLGPKPQGVWMGILTSTGSFSRVAGPIFISYIYTKLGTRWTFGSITVLMLIALFETVYFYKRLVPLQVIATETSDPLT